MKNILLATVSALTFIGSAQAYAAKTVYSVIDLSNSAAPAVDQNIANQIAQRVNTDIRALEIGDSVKIRSLGNSGTARAQLHLNAEITKRLRPRAAAKQLSRIVSSLPKKVKDGTISLEPSTNIIGFFEALSPSLKCAEEETTIVVYSDAIEWSEIIDGQKLLSGKATLPKPSGRILEGCNVIFRGVGQQHSGLETKPTWFPNLKVAWSEFMEATGARSFKAYAYYGD